MPSETHHADHAPMHRLLAALPGPVRGAFVWLQRPEMIWVRLPAALLLICGGFLGFLPVLGFWMAPIGVLLLAEDVPPLRRPSMRALGAVQRWWDRWRAR